MPLVGFPHIQPSSFPKPYKEGNSSIKSRPFLGTIGTMNALIFLQQLNVVYQGGSFTEASKICKAMSILKENALQNDSKEPSKKNGNG